MAREYERNRDKIIELVSSRLENTDDARAIKYVRRLCRIFEVPATDENIAEMAAEAIRRRLVEKAKALASRLVVAESNIVDIYAQLENARTAFIELKSRVDSYHP